MDNTTNVGLTNVPVNTGERKGVTPLSEHLNHID